MKKPLVAPVHERPKRKKPLAGLVEMMGVEPTWGLAPGDWHRDSYPTVLIPIGGGISRPRGG